MVPEAFLARMRELSGLDFEAFCAALAEPAVRALRVNTIKTDAARLLPLLSFPTEPIPFVADAFYANADKVGGEPAHHAGMFYMQDPSAISAVAAVPLREGMRVLDLCAAPGGKTTQLAAAIGNAGVLVSNEYVSSRARILQGNVERMGAVNTIVTNLDTAALARCYGAVFDLVVVDAPCSGEGMFRKYDVAGEEWSEENVALCAARQREILKNAAACVAPGGMLLYSTCTFSREENEQNIAAFLDTFGDFSLIPVNPAIAAVTADGIPTQNHPELALARRFYPHLSPGEGQFLALMRRAADDVPLLPNVKQVAPCTKELTVLRNFLRDVLATDALAGRRFVRLRDDVFTAPDFPLPPSGVIAAGVCLGTFRQDRIEPHHAFCSAYGKDFARQLRLAAGDPRVTAYLRGEEIDCPELTKNGYAAVLFEGAPLGGGKAVNGRLKNHYPKGLRLRG